jgi:hypothetical protein
MDQNMQVRIVHLQETTTAEGAVEGKRAIEQVAKQKWRAIENCTAEKRHRKPSKRNRITSHQGDPGYGPIDAYRRILRDDGLTA